MTVRERNLRAIGAVGDLPDGGRMQVTVDGRAICVVHVDGEYFALRSTCPHQGRTCARGR